MSEKKIPGKDLRKDYQVTLQSSLIIALLLAVIIFKLNVSLGGEFVIEELERNELVLDDAIQTIIIETPPPPPRPPVPIEVPEDAVIDDELLNMDASLYDIDDFDTPPARLRKKMMIPREPFL